MNLAYAHNWGYERLNYYAQGKYSSSKISPLERWLS